MSARGGVARVARASGAVGVDERPLELVLDDYFLPFAHQGAYLETFVHHGRRNVANRPLRDRRRRAGSGGERSV